MLLNKPKLLEAGNASLIWELWARGASGSGPISYNQPDTAQRGPESAPVKLLSGPPYGTALHVLAMWSSNPLHAPNLSVRVGQTAISRYLQAPWRPDINYVIGVVCRASLSHTRVRDVREIVGLPARSPHQTRFLQFQRGLRCTHIQGPHCFRILRGEGHGVSGVQKGESLFWFLCFLNCEPWILLLKLLSFIAIEFLMPVDSKYR